VNDPGHPMAEQQPRHVFNREETTRKKKIVIAEDSAIYRSVLAESLENFQIVSEPEDGEQAIALVHSTRPDLLILDLFLPRLSGFEVIKELRRHYPSLKILVLTIHDSETYRDQALQLGADVYCLKDDRRENLLATVH
jgi:DNA-binding NarL/FixJ family response regulator